MTSSSHSSGYILYFSLLLPCFPKICPWECYFTKIYLNLSFHLSGSWHLPLFLSVPFILQPTVQANLFGSCSWLPPLACNLHAFPKRICPATVLSSFVTPLCLSWNIRWDSCIRLERLITTCLRECVLILEAIVHSNFGVSIYLGTAVVH